MITLRKNILLSSEKDVRAGMDFLKKFKSDNKLPENIDLGFEGIIRYSDLDKLEILKKNLRFCKCYPLSLHTPLNPSAPERVDLLGEGYRVAEKILEFADENNAEFVVTNPNALRSSEYFEKNKYSKEKREEMLSRLINNTNALNKNSEARLILENKPQPATDESNKGIFYSPIAALFSHLKKISESGIRIAFDTAHYAITRATVSSLLSDSSKRIYGIYPEDLELQPEIPDALAQLGDSIAEIHLNDTAPYKIIEGNMTYTEALVPGEGEFVKNEDIIPFVKRRKSNISVLFEVNETDYFNSPNAYKAMKNFLIAWKHNNL